MIVFYAFFSLPVFIQVYVEGNVAFLTRWCR